MTRLPRHPRKPPASQSQEPEDGAVSAEPTTSPDPNPEPNYQHFSRSLRARRTKLGLTQVELSVKAGVALGTVHLIEASRQNPTLKSLVTLAEAVGLKIGDLLPQSMPPGEEVLRQRLLTILGGELEATRRIQESAAAQVGRLEELMESIRDKTPL